MNQTHHSLSRQSWIGATLSAVLMSLTGCGGGNPAIADTQTIQVAASADMLTAGGTIAKASYPAARLPISVAGPDQVVEQDAFVALDGGASSIWPATAVLTYMWTQTGGPAVRLSDPSMAKPTFKPPPVAAVAVLTFMLTVRAAAGGVATDSVSVTVHPGGAWGVAPSAALSYNPARWLPAMADAGVTTVRGFYSTASADGLPPITDAGMSAVGILQWSAGSTQSLPVNDLPGWRKYVTDQVTRYRGRVRHWEVWNEPPNFTADRSPLSYAKVVAAAYDAAKAADPSVQIGLAAKSNHINWLAETIAGGAVNKFDFITLHPYEVAGMLPQGWEGQFMGIAPRVQAMLRDKNPSRADVPLWFTEIGIPASPPAAGGVGPQVQADVLVKVFTMALAQGVARTYWFDPSDSEGLTMGLTTSDGSKRPSWFALRSLSSHLGKQPSYAGWTQPRNAYYGFVFNGPQGVVLSAWTRAGQSAPLALASDVTVVDPRSGAARTSRAATLTESPLLLVAPPQSAQAQQWLREAAANVGKPFPWNGDHSSAASVTLTAGQVPDGLFLVNPPPMSMVNGKAEFSFAGRGGPVFAVDPSFLSYASTPIQIKVVMRGHGNGSPGFNLKYESSLPIASADGNGLVSSGSGWTQVVGSTLYEKTWTLPNARFIGLYGYNFSLDSDGPAHSQFSIHSVAVSR